MRHQGLEPDAFCRISLPDGDIQAAYILGYSAADYLRGLSACGGEAVFASLGPKVKLAFSI
jgi:hypothetical protein